MVVVNDDIEKKISDKIWPSLQIKQIRPYNEFDIISFKHNGKTLYQILDIRERIFDIILPVRNNVHVVIWNKIIGNL